MCLRKLYNNSDREHHKTQIHCKTDSLYVSASLHHQIIYSLQQSFIQWYIIMAAGRNMLDIRVWVNLFLVAYFVSTFIFYRSLPCSQQPKTDLGVQPYESNQHSSIVYFKMHSTVILPSTHTPSKWFPSFKFSSQVPLSLYIFSHACHMPIPFNPPLFIALISGEECNPN